MTATTVGELQIVRAVWFSTHHASARDLLTASERPVTPPSYGLLVGRARRFTSLATQLHIEVCGALQGDIPDPERSSLAVFATCHGEIQTAAQLIADLRDTATVSSARFALSVHNTPSGLYSAAVGSTAPTTTVTGAGAIAAGWLEAALTAFETGRPVVLSIADEPVPAVFHSPPEPAGVAAGFVLAPAPAAGRRARLVIAPRAHDHDLPPHQVLARAVDGWMRAESSAVILGGIRPGAALELQFAPGGGGLPAGSVPA